jgi:hypothetical protein
MAVAKTGTCYGFVLFGSAACRRRIVFFIEMFAGGRRGILHVGPEGSRLELVDSHAAA